MAAPLASALGYFLAPQVARQAALRLGVPDKAAPSGIPTALEALGALLSLYRVNTQPEQQTDTSPNYSPAFPTIETRDALGGIRWESPIDDYLTYGGTDSSEIPSSASYGQTDRPAPDITFDVPGAEWGSTGGMYRLLQEQNDQQELPEFVDPGFARGGLLSLLRAHNAKHKR